jgi:hypothetical protein
MLLLCFFSVNSLAAYTCTGLVKGVSIEAKTGDLLVAQIGELKWPRLCKVDNEYDRISAEACKVVYSTLITAQTSKKKVTLWFNDAKSCTEHDAWRPIPGWYFGPMLVD